MTEDLTDVDPEFSCVMLPPKHRTVLSSVDHAYITYCKDSFGDGVRATSIASRIRRSGRMATLFPLPAMVVLENFSHEP